MCLKYLRTSLVSADCMVQSRWSANLLQLTAVCQLIIGSGSWRFGRILCSTISSSNRLISRLPYAGAATCAETTANLSGDICGASSVTGLHKHSTVVLPGRAGGVRSCGFRWAHLASPKSRLIQPATHRGMNDCVVWQGPPLRFPREGGPLQTAMRAPGPAPSPLGLCC